MLSLQNSTSIDIAPCYDVSRRVLLHANGIFFSKFLTKIYITRTIANCHVVQEHGEACCRGPWFFPSFWVILHWFSLVQWGSLKIRDRSFDRTLPHLFISVFRVRNGSVVAAGAGVSSVSLFLFPELPQRDFVIAALQQKRGAVKRKRNHVQFFD